MKKPNGRPRIPQEMRRQGMDLSLDPQIRDYLRSLPNASEYVEQLIREDLARQSKRQRG